MNLGTLIIFSGLPGSGKSTMSKLLAEKFKITYLRIDTIEHGLREVCGIDKIDGKGYRLTYRIAQENLKCGNNVIADSVNSMELTREEWNNVAREIGALFINIEVVCSDKVEHQKRVEGRAPSVPGMNPPTWDAVLKRHYESWVGERIILDTAGKTEEQSFNDLVSLLKQNRFSERVL